MIHVTVGYDDLDDMESLVVLKTIELALTQMHDVTVVKPVRSEIFCRHDLMELDEYTPFTVTLREA